MYTQLNHIYSSVQSDSCVRSLPCSSDPEDIRDQVQRKLREWLRNNRKSGADYLRHIDSSLKMDDIDRLFGKLS